MGGEVYLGGSVLDTAGGLSFFDGIGKGTGCAALPKELISDAHLTIFPTETLSFGTPARLQSTLAYCVSDTESASVILSGYS